jgi:cell division septal protein FtsQ
VKVQSYELEMRAMRRRVRLLRAALLAIAAGGSVLLWLVTR